MNYLVTHRMLKILSKIYNSPPFGFIKSHQHLDRTELSAIESLVGKTDDGVVAEFESNYARLIGNGNCIAFGAARMGFFSIMKTLSIGKGDEVILTGFTCSVMANAVIRVGATPIYSDVDEHTLGSSSREVAKCITARTKLIVAQHSFGIPCDIKPIVKYAKKNEIFLLEDCALALGSAIGDKTVGSFGDAAIFSTDHTKPLNTLIGGLVYSTNDDLLSKIGEIRAKSPEIPIKKQKALWRRFRIERYLCHEERMRYFKFFTYVQVFLQKAFFINDPFLTSDYGVSISNADYTYPCKIPAFVAQIGVFELNRWADLADKRVSVLREILCEVSKSEISKFIPQAYLDPSLKIVPLRFAWSMPNGGNLRLRLSSLVDVDATWFLEPIISRAGELEEYGYAHGLCEVSERIGANMINVPCDLDENAIEKIFDNLNNITHKSYG